MTFSSPIVAAILALFLGGNPLVGYKQEPTATGPLYWRGWSEYDRLTVKRLLPEVLGMIEERLNRPLDSPFRTVLASDGFEFRKVVTALSGEAMDSDYTVGVAIPGLNVLVLRGGMPPGTKSFLDTLTHEVAHLVIHKGAKSSIPRWLDEGVATWVAGEAISPRDEAYLALLARAGGLYPLRRLEKPFPGGYHPTSVAYQQSFLFTVYLHETYGAEAIPRLIDLAARGLGGEEILRIVTGESMAEVEKAFARWVAQRRSLPAALLVLFNPWTVCALLALVAIFLHILRRRRRLRELEAED